MANFGFLEQSSSKVILLRSVREKQELSPVAHSEFKDSYTLDEDFAFKI